MGRGLRALLMWSAVATVVAGCGGDASRPADQRQSGPDQTVLWGAWVDRHRTGTLPPWDMSGIDQVERSVQKRMSLVEFGTPFTDKSGSRPFAFPTAQFDAVAAHGATPLFSWGSHAMRNYANPAFSLRAIAAGTQDAYIRRWAQSARAWQKPFLLRFNWEMNGDWFPWSERYGHQTPGEYVRAWRHVHAIFEHAGATNARWVWCPVADPKGRYQPLASVYPGDGYVDWTCLDAYNRGAPWLSATEILGPTYDQISTTIAPSKPMLVAEIASTEIGGDKAAWIDELFAALPRRFPRIRGLVWFDGVEGVTGADSHTNWPLDSSVTATDAFARGIRATRYVAGGDS